MVNIKEFKMYSFIANKVLCNIVESDDSDMVYHDNSNGESRSGAYDPFSSTIYLHSGLHPDQKRKILIHEVCHALLFEYGWYDGDDKFNEENICNFIASHYEEIGAVVDGYFENVE